MTTAFIVDTETAGSTRFKIVTFGCFGLKTCRARKEGFEGKKSMCSKKGGAVCGGGRGSRESSV